MNNKDLDELFAVFGRENVIVFDEVATMKGKVTKVVASKGFGFVKGEDGKEYFFHQSGYNGFFNDLEVDFDAGRVIEVTFDPNPKSPKGPRAENITRIDSGV